MIRPLPSTAAGLTTVWMLAFVLSGGGCSVARQPLPLVEPSYSVRDAEPSLAAADLWPASDGLRAADAETLPIAHVEEYESLMLGSRLSDATLDGVSELMTVE